MMLVAGCWILDTGCWLLDAGVDKQNKTGLFKIIEQPRFYKQIKISILFCALLYHNKEYTKSPEVLTNKHLAHQQHL